MTDNDDILDDDFDDDLDDDFDDDEFKDEIDVSENKLENKSLQMQQMINHFELRLSGYMLKKNGEKYYYTGETLIGEKSIQDIMFLLHPFSREINMISDKNRISWEKQKLMTRLSFINILVPAIDGNVRKFWIIWRSFSNLLTNIGDIIVGKNSQKVLRGFWGLDENNGLDDFFDSKKKKKHTGEDI